MVYRSRLHGGKAVTVKRFRKNGERNAGFFHAYSAFFTVSACHAVTCGGPDVLAELFARKNIEGTLVLSSLQSEQTFVHNDERSNRRFAVASTFKIPTA